MDLLTAFKWLSHTPVGLYMQQSGWAFPVVETIHLFALAVLGGAVLTVNLTTLGAICRVPVPRLAAGLFPVTLGSLVVLIVTGVFMLSDEALKCYYSEAFRAKMLALGLALVVFFPLHTLEVRIQRSPPWWLRIGAAISMLLWLSVGLAGRAIGFH
jgi:hypothetical protein